MITEEQMARCEKEFTSAVAVSHAKARDAERSLEAHQHGGGRRSCNPEKIDRLYQEFLDADYEDESRAWILDLVKAGRNGDLVAKENVGPPHNAVCFFDIVFDGPPGKEPGRFVEVEDPFGKNISKGEWILREDGYWVLRISEAGLKKIYLCQATFDGNTVKNERSFESVVIADDEEEAKLLLGCRQGYTFRILGPAVADAASEVISRISFDGPGV